MFRCTPRWLLLFALFFISCAFSVSEAFRVTPDEQDESSLTYLWPLPSEFTSGDESLSVDPSLTLSVAGNGGDSNILRAAFDRYRGIIFKHRASSGFGFGFVRKLRESIVVSHYDIATLKITVHSDDEEVPLVPLALKFGFFFIFFFLGF